MKYAYFLLYKESTNAEEFAYVFLYTIASNHLLPEEIISDRGSVFALKFWQGLISRLGMNHKLSIAYHPQIDGQTERINQIVEGYLRCYVNLKQDDWAELLPTAQIADNTDISESTGISLMFAKYRYDPEVYKTP